MNRSKSRALLIPSYSDPRVGLILFFLCFITYAILAPVFNRNAAQFLAAVGACVGLDLILLLAYKRVYLFPMSGLISSMGTFLLTDSRFVWPYFLVGSLAILSKHFITVNGKHIFNPNNFGLVVALLFFGEDLTVAAGRWGGSLEGMVLIACLGTYVCYRARRLDLVLSYVLTFLAGIVARSLITGRDMGMIAAPLTGAAFQLFIFYMITDPQTTPKTRKRRIAFGIALAILDTVMRYYQVKFAPFYSLFVLTAALPWIEGSIRAPRTTVDGPVWKLRTINWPRR